MFQTAHYILVICSYYTSTPTHYITLLMAVFFVIPYSLKSSYTFLQWKKSPTSTSPTIHWWPGNSYCLTNCYLLMPFGTRLCQSWICSLQAQREFPEITASSESGDHAISNTNQAAGISMFGFVKQKRL